MKNLFDNSLVILSKIGKNNFVRKSFFDLRVACLFSNDIFSSIKNDLNF